MNIYELTWSCKMQGETPEEAMRKAWAMLTQFVAQSSGDPEDYLVWKLIANDMSMMEYLVATSQPSERSMRTRARELGIPFPGDIA